MAALISNMLTIGTSTSHWRVGQTDTGGVRPVWAGGKGEASLALSLRPPFCQSLSLFLDGDEAVLERAHDDGEDAQAVE